MLLKTWFGLVCTILLASLFTLMFNFEINKITHWISLIALILAIVLTILVYLEQPHKKEIRKLEKTYKEFILQKDKKISELEDRNKLIFKTAVKHSEDNIQLNELKKRLEEKTK